MRSIIISSMKPVLFIMTILDFFFLFKMFQEYRTKRNSQSLLVGLICIGLFYDSLILFLGNLMPFGNVLKFLSQFRYIFHCFLIPLLFPVCFDAINISKKYQKIIWILTLIIMLVGLISGIAVVTTPVSIGNLNRYASSALTPAFSQKVTSLLDTVPVFFMIGIGTYILMKKKNPNMMLSGIFMLVFTLLGIFLGKDPSGDPTKSLMFYISMYGESLMVFFLYRFIQSEN